MEDVKPEDIVKEVTNSEDVDAFLKVLHDEAEKESAKEQLDTSTVMEGKTLEASGVITDSEGHTWVVPDANADDLNDLNQIPGIARIKKDPRFEYQTISVNEMDEYLTNQWVLVTRKEAELPEIQIQKEGYGTSLASYIHYMDSVMVKKPKELVMRDRARLDAPAREAMESVAPSEEMLEKMREAGIPVQHRHRRHGAMTEEDTSGFTQL